MIEKFIAFHCLWRKGYSNKFFSNSDIWTLCITYILNQSECIKSVFVCVIKLKMCTVFLKYVKYIHVIFHNLRKLLQIGGKIQGERVHWAVCYASPQSFIILFSWQLWGLVLNFGVSLLKLSVQTFESLIVIYRMSNFVHHHRRYTSINRPLSYPFRSLAKIAKK